MSRFILLKMKKDITNHRFTTDLDKQKISVKLLIFSYSSVLAYVLGAQKNILLSTSNICFG